jgi:hypothetical protein
VLASTIRGAAGLVLLPAEIGVALVRAVDRSLREQAADRVGRASVALIDGALESRYADEAVRRIVESRLAERAATLVLDRVEAAGVPQRLVERLLADGIAEQVAARLFEGPELERVVERALESPGVERMLTRIVESRVVDETVARVMEEVAQRLPRTEAMWDLVDEIVTSPTVTEAITQQGAGFADQMAGTVRAQSRTADARLERLAWRLLRRRPPTPDGSATGGPA